MLFALAIAVNGFAHRAVAAVPGPSIPNVSVPDLSAYVLPDGTVPVLCRALSGDEPVSGLAPGSCPACKLNLVNALPPTPCDVIGVPIAYLEITYPDVTASAAGPAATVRPRVRAPPA